MALTTSEGNQGGQDRPPLQAGPHDSMIQDRRGPWRFWIPTYVFRLFGSRIGPNGMSLYAALAWHCTRESKERWPALAKLGEEIGVSRSTVVRTLKVLAAQGLIEVHPCVTPSGQRSHYIYLVHPPEVTEQPDQDGMEPARPVNLTAPPCQVDKGPLSDCQGGAVNLTAPSVDPELEKEVCENGARTLPLRQPTQNPPKPDVEALAALFVDLGPWKRRHVRDDVYAEALAELAELARRGWTAAALRAAIEDKDRKREEWPRELRARLVKQAEATTPALKSPDEVMARILADRQRAEDEARASASPEEIRELARRARAKLKAEADGIK